MEDAVRPNEQAFKAMYDKGYRTWASLHEMTTTDTKTDSPWWESLFRLDSTLFNHPPFPKCLAVNKSFSNTAMVSGTSTWRTTNHLCNLPPFDQDFSISVATNHPTILVISPTRQSASVFPPIFKEGEDDHTTILILAWSYILSARWAETIPGASHPKYTECEAALDTTSFPSDECPTSTDKTSVVDLGDIEDDAARWWAAVLAQEGGWFATLSSDAGHSLHSPWYTKLISDQRFLLSRTSRAQSCPSHHTPPSFTTALRYLISYCEFHMVAKQSHAALAATLLLPVARFDNRKVQLETPRLSCKVRCNEKTIHRQPAWGENIDQLDRLLALSCNAVGIKALLTSVFYESAVESNICGAWLQGAFAFLDSDVLQNPYMLLRILMKRDPSLGFLWLGAFILGIHERSLQEARQAWWKIDLHVAAWTGTLLSFIQEPVSTLQSGSHEISRADECRLMYLSHDQSYTTPPLFPFAPFGFTALCDTNIDVRQHTGCEGGHSLELAGLSWRSRDGQCVSTTRPIPLRAKNRHSLDSSISVDYENLDYEDDDCSEMVTRNIFTWMRDEDGFPAAERPIREHEWIDNLDSDDDSPITGNAQSVVGGKLHGWLSKTMTKRSYTL